MRRKTALFAVAIATFLFAALAFANAKGAEGTGLGGSGETILIAEIALLLFVGRGLGEALSAHAIEP